MHLQALPALSDNYIWLLADTRGQALVVDPGEDGPVEAALSHQDLKLNAILVTHHHGDHTGGVAALRERHGARVYAPHDERITAVDQRVEEDSIITPLPKGPSFRVLEIPGHTRSHIAYVSQDLLFCGDTLFHLGCGRLFEGTPAQMLAALDRLTTLPEDTRVCCGHEYTLANAAFAQHVDPDNTPLAECIELARTARQQGQPSLPSRIGQERAANPFMRCDSPAVRQWAMREGVADDRLARFTALREAKNEFRA